MKTLKLLVILLLEVFQLSTSAQPNYTPIRSLKEGQIRGLIETVGGGKKVEFYEGIKYAQAKRFEKPQPEAPWTGIYEATQKRHACPQFGAPPMADAMVGNVTQSEDCLYLNLWRPVEESTSGSRPVMVWIHGGAFETGTIFTDAYNAGHIAATGDLIVVTINYRLGPLGWLAGGGVPGNLGLHDQIQALKWVQENIHVFGGDRKQVTIFGESAGSMSVASMVISPLARGLFSRAIAQSGAPIGSSLGTSLEKGQERMMYYAKKVNCGSLGKNSRNNLNETILHCLRGKSVKELQVGAIGDFTTNHEFLPVFGVEVLPHTPKVAFQKGAFNAVDYIYGVTRNEGPGFLMLFFPELVKPNVSLTTTTAKQYIVRLMALYEMPQLGNEVANFYIDQLHNPSVDDLRMAIGDVWGDALLVCPSILFGEELAKHSQMTKHLYSYRLMQAADALFAFPGYQKWMGIIHGSDVAFLFANPNLFPSHQNFSAAFTALSKSMMLDWTNFARTGRPHSPAWTEAFNRETDDFSTRYYHLEASHYKMVPGYYTEICEKFWKSKIFN